MSQAAALVGVLVRDHNERVVQADVGAVCNQRTNNRTAYVNWMLEHKQAINSWYKNPAFVRDESIAVHGKTIREAITLEFGSGALLVLRESQAWFRERVHRFLKEGGDPAF